jgi:hypothetical protein
MRRFMDGEVAIPMSLSSVPEEYRGRKYRLTQADIGQYQQLSLEDRECLDDYELTITQYDEIPENDAMDIFVRLQGGKSLTKTEIRAALGGKVCDFVTELTSGSQVPEEDAEEDTVEASHHPFFQELAVRNSRKAHRNVCDILLHEYLNPGRDKHWSSLEALYRDKAGTLSDKDKSGFRDSLSRFRRASVDPVGGKMTPLYRSAFLVLTYYRAWRELTEKYALPGDFSFFAFVAKFEGTRTARADEIPWVNFNAALSNAGYAKVRTDARHEILMAFVLQELPTLVAKDQNRAFTIDQKIAIWYRAGQQCEWLDGQGPRCEKKFADFREADADHFVRWVEGGPTTVENGRLLYQTHNRQARPG